MGNARNIAFWVVLFLLILALFNLFSGPGGTLQSREITFSEFVASVGQGEVAQVTLDGSPLNAAAVPISSGFSVARAKLGPGTSGAHVLNSDKPVGIQVMGYGSYTSYQYPGGLNLTAIAPPPPPIR